jgi:ATP/maltotriose-dependent transcriptional regulator MalT
MPKAAPYLLAWSATQQSYMLSWRATNEMLDLVPESPVWFAWLEEASSFAFQGKVGVYTARKESIRQGDAYWYAYRRTGEKLLKKYVGKTTDVTLARLEQVAGALSADRDTRLRARHEERSQPTQIDAHTSGASLEGGDGADADRTPQTSSVQRDPLLATKLYVPRPRTQLVHRSHLIERLQQGMECALTLVSAPAGFGKTTLLAQWLAESGTPVAWLSLEPEDNDPVRFLTYLIAALQTRNPQLGVNILELLEASQSTPLESALIVLSNDIINRQIADFVLVLDDYHTIASESIDRAMTFLIEHLPPQVHLILATRADPPLPLSRLRARGQLVELRAADLRMNSAETNTLLHTVMGLNLPDEAISALENRTEGWVAGLQLAALSLHGRRDISTFLAAFSGSHRFVLDYLSEEVLSRQSAPVLSFLLQTSILERLSGPLCDAVTAQEGGQSMLESLEQANLFTNALDEERRWYRYHHLFAEVLRRRLQQAQPLLVPELHRRASLWYEQHEQPIEAVSHALAAEDVKRAARLIEQYGMLVIARGQTRTLLEWLNALPNALVHTRPLLCIYHAAALHLIDQVEEAEARLHDAERAISSQTPAEQARNIRGIAATVSANIARYSGNVSRYVSLGQQAYELLPESNLMLRATAGMQAAYTYLVNGDVTPTIEKKVRFAAITSSSSLF